MSPILARKGAVYLTGTIGTYSVAVALLASTGFFRAIPPPVFGLFVGGMTAFLLISARLVPSVAALVAALGPQGLASFHIWRIGAALLFYAYGSQGLLPARFVSTAGHGDLIAGLMALGLLFAPDRPRALWVFHLYGLADLVVAVGTALTLALSGEALMLNIGDLPVVLVPLVAVPISAASHLLAIGMLWRGKPRAVKSPRTT